MPNSADSAHPITINADAHPPLDRAAIIRLVRGIAPVDPAQLRLTQRLTPAQRILAGAQAQAFAMAIYRGALRARYPDMPLAELNMKVLAHFTPLRMRRS